MAYFRLVGTVVLVAAAFAIASESPAPAEAAPVAATAPSQAAAQPALQPAAQSTQPEETPVDTSFRMSHENVLTIVGVYLSHHALRNSVRLHSWPFFAAAAPAVSTSFKVEKDFGKLLSICGNSNAAITPVNVGASIGFDLSLFHMLEFSTRGNASTAVNYGKTSTFLGVYNPEKRDFDKHIIFTEGMFSVLYKTSVTIPLLAFLPKTSWTKIILKGYASLENSFYTGAEDGDMWKVGSDIRGNGYRGEVGGTFIYMFPFKRVNMAMVTVKASGYLHEGDFDEVYHDYDPDFKTYSVNPMLMFKLGEKWNGMAMLPIVRERKFEKYRYKSNEELLQKRVGTQWKMNIFMCMLNRRF